MTALAELTKAQRVVLVDPNHLPQLWERLEPLVAKACRWSQGTFEPVNVVDGMLTGALTMLAFVDGDDVLSIAVLTISEFPTGLRVCEVLLASGEGLKDWRAFQPQVAEYARSLGCTRFRMIGREGLARMLPDWKRTAIVLEAEIV